MEIAFAKSGGYSNTPLSTPKKVLFLEEFIRWLSQKTKNSKNMTVAT